MLQKNTIGFILTIVVILIAGVVLVIYFGRSSTKVDTSRPGSWLYRVDLTKCDAIVDRGNLQNELVVVHDPDLTWQHRCVLDPTPASIKAMSLRSVAIDAMYDEHGFIDPVGNAAKFHHSEPLLDYVSDQYVGKYYDDIFQEPYAVSEDLLAIKYSVEAGYVKMKSGTFATVDGEGAYVVVDSNRADLDVQSYYSYTHFRKGSCNILIETALSYDQNKRTVLEKEIVKLAQKIDGAIKGECGVSAASSP